MGDRICPMCYCLNSVWFCSKGSCPNASLLLHRHYAILQIVNKSSLYPNASPVVDEYANALGKLHNAVNNSTQLDNSTLQTLISLFEACGIP